MENAPAQRLVIFNEGIFIAALALSKVAWGTVEIHRDALARKIVLQSGLDSVHAAIQDQDLMALYVEQCLRSLNGGSSLTLKQLPELYEPVLATTVTSMERFIAAHEVAHIALRHDLGAALDGGDEYPTPAEWNRIRRSWNREFEADQFAINTLIKMIKERRKPWDGAWLTGPAMFFSVGDCFERLRYIKRNLKVPKYDLGLRADLDEYGPLLKAGTLNKKIFSDIVLEQSSSERSHPPSWLRLARIQQILSAKVDELLSEDERSIYKGGLLACTGLTIIQRVAEDGWVKYFRNGERLPIISPNTR